MNLFDVYPLYDVTPVKSKGCYVYDDKGQKYLDLYGGHGFKVEIQRRVYLYDLSVSSTRRVPR